MGEPSAQEEENGLISFIRPSFSMVGNGRLISWDQRDSMMGFLILIIMIGHNFVLGGTDSALFNWIYASPVILIFMTLPVLTMVKPMTASRARDLVTRYMVPYVIFATAVAVMFWLTGGSDRSWQEQLGYWGLTMLMNNGKAASTMAQSGYLWFLPAFLAFQLCLGLYYRLSPLVTFLFFLALMAAFAFIGQGEDSWTAVLPFSLGVTIYCLPLSILIAHGVNKLQHAKHRFMLGGVLLLICVGLTMITNSWDSQYRIHRTVVYSVLQFDEFAVHILRVIAGSIGMLLIVPPLIGNFRPFLWIGRNVLVIYLAHLPIFRALVAASRAAGHDPVSVLDGTLILIVTLSASCGLAWAIGSVDWLRMRIMPRDFQQLKQVLGLGETKTHRLNQTKT
jgi:hypothetical protein